MHRNPCLVLGCTDKDALREAFGKFGAVAEVFCPEGQTFGFVTFEDKYDAENAMNALNGTQIGGKTVEVSDALPRAPPGARTGPLRSSILPFLIFPPGVADERRGPLSRPREGHRREVREQARLRVAHLFGQGVGDESVMRLRAGNPKKKMQSEGVDESAPTRPGAPRGGIFLYEQVDVTSFFLFYRCF